ncbi:hypothetical protein G4X40_19930 [Rhodococcus sp. D2-41]|uniref:hypothetical protein n=1 Tax=Speluncibacter jeojiensis TaxID=2710754 RepID=UPI00240FA595|nr:hypothetical protein [Rhodococcus sp. D2-41]MDG3012413.1 hypothetical protein [Rhodococcus sp. D2-41]
MNERRTLTFPGRRFSTGEVNLQATKDVDGQWIRQTGSQFNPDTNTTTVTFEVLTPEQIEAERVRRLDQARSAIRIRNFFARSPR